MSTLHKSFTAVLQRTVTVHLDERIPRTRRRSTR